jgi:hypothetical protein
MTVAYVLGGWATNVGNSFYDLGAINLLEQACGPREVVPVANVASWFWTTPNSIDMLGDVVADTFVFAGPILHAALGHRYATAFDKIKAAGGRIAFVSTGASEYTEAEERQVRATLDGLGDSLAFVATRDTETFKTYRDLPCPVYDGICSSMFVADAVNVPDLRRPPYVVLNFQARDEPDLEYADGEFTVHNRPAPKPRSSSRIARLAARARPRTPATLDRPTMVGPFEIVRTRSESFTRNTAQAFDRPSMFSSDLPYGYLALYKSAEAVFTNRVHTCAATLILGGRVRYVANTPRSKDGRSLLLDRVGATPVREGLASLDQARIAEEKAALVDFVRKALV